MTTTAGQTVPPHTAADSESTSFPNIEIFEIESKHEITSHRPNEPPVWSQLIVWIRISILVFSMLLFILSVAYTVASLVETKLAIIQQCPEPREPQEIWEHSYQSGLKDNGEVIIDEQSHWGHSKDACWTTRSIEINLDNIWYSNQYDWEWKTRINGKCILFGLLSLCWIVVIFYGATTLTMDLVFVSKGTLHTKSRLYRIHVRNQKRNNHTEHLEDEIKHSRTNCITRFMKWYLGIYFKYYAVDTLGFVILKVASETTEFTIQFVALLKYNGYFHDLAVKPEAVLTFAIILSFNMFGSGLLWSLYTLFPTQCHGLIFKRSLFFVDKVSDLMYTLFPIYVILADDFNENATDIMVLLGQLSIDGWYFITAFTPSLFLCTNCLVMSITSRERMKNEYFKRWRKTLNIDSSRKRNSSKAYDKNWIHKNDSTWNRMLRRVLLAILALTFLGVGLFSLIFTAIHLRSAESHCASVIEGNFMINGFFENVTVSESEKSTLSTNPELFVWPYCRYKVYPFIDDERYQCQCRVFVIDWDSDLESTLNERERYLNVTRGDMLNGVMNHWFMMERMWIQGDLSGEEYNVSFNSMQRSVHLKALGWDDLRQTTAFEENLFDHWQELEFLFIGTTYTFPALPDSFGRLSKLRHLELYVTGIPNVFPLLCNLTNLEVLWLTAELVGDELPDCIAQLRNLQLFIFDVSSLYSFPLSLLTLPKLKALSLSRHLISWDTLLDGNLPSNIDRNDTEQVMNWLDENFLFSNETEYYLALDPICYENVSFLTPKISDFMETACSWPASLSEIPTDKSTCSPYKLGDGQCNAQCNDISLLFDMGDCMQTCFVAEISNCTLDKIANNQCDPGCNNRYCIAYPFDADDTAFVSVQDVEFSTETMWTTHDANGTVFAADGFLCPWNESISKANISEEYPLCSESSTKSLFLDPNVPEDTYSVKCDPSWIGDATCDDACRIEDCGYDEDACTSGCTEGYCSAFLIAWDFANQGKYQMNYTYGCEVLWPLAQLYFFYEESVINCTQLLPSLDYNGDNLMNFREFVAFGMLAVNDFETDMRGPQVRITLTT